MSDKPILVFQTDFTQKEGAVAAMYGVVKSVDSALEIMTATHEIPPFDIWSASVRLSQYMGFWPKGTVFVSVVDPGVGTARRAAAAVTDKGHYIFTPDNGTLTHVAEAFGIKQVREINESRHRLAGSGTEDVAVFHGRDLFAHCAAKYASGIIAFEETGPEYPVEEIVRFPLFEPTVYDDGSVGGIVEAADPNFGNLWTNIETKLLKDAGFSYGECIEVTISYKRTPRLQTLARFERSFGYAAKGAPVIYNNELSKVALAISEGNLAETYGLGFGVEWEVRLAPCGCDDKEK